MGRDRRPREPYKQFMFHFEYPRNSIDARVITDEELKWCLEIYEYCSGPDSPQRSKEWSHYKTIEKMFELWFPEYLV